MFLERVDKIIRGDMPEEAVRMELRRIRTTDVRIDGLTNNYLKLKFKPHALVLLGWLLTSPPLTEEWQELRIIKWDDDNYSKLNKIASKHGLRIHPFKEGVIALLSDEDMVVKLDEYGHINISVSYSSYLELLSDIAELYGIDP